MSKAREVGAGFGAAACTRVNVDIMTGRPVSDQWSILDPTNQVAFSRTGNLVTMHFESKDTIRTKVDNATLCPIPDGFRPASNEIGKEIISNCMIKIAIGSNHIARALLYSDRIKMHGRHLMEGYTRFSGTWITDDPYPSI